MIFMYQSQVTSSLAAIQRIGHRDDNCKMVYLASRNLKWFSFTVCGKVVDNTLKSPGYPNDYPNNTDCIYVVPIPPDMDMKITFKDFYIEDDPSCR